jgi:DNA-binding beta-propeller fold protein YncE
MPGVVAPAAPDRRHPPKGTATITIRIPHRHKHRSHYVSASTQSIAIVVDGGSPAVINLTATSPNCSFVATELQCTFGIRTTLGSHVFSLITYDKPNAKGNRLSANTDVPFTVVQGSNTPLNVTLGGVATSLAVLPPNAPQVTGSQTAGFVMYGNVAQTFTVVPVDADANYIMGAGAPTVSVSPVPPSVPLTVGTPVPGSPTLWSIKSTYAATNPLATAPATLTVISTPVPNSGGSRITATVNFGLYQPWIYVANNSGSPEVSVFTDAGVAEAAATGGFTHVPTPSGVAYDPHNQWLYIPSSGDSVVCVYDVMGNLIGVSGSWSQMGSPNDIAYVPTTNFLYTANGTGDSGADVLAYDESGTLQTLTAPSPFPNVGYPNGIAYDAQNGWIYVTDGVGETVNAYDMEGNQQSLPSGAFVTPESVSSWDPTNIAVDPHDGNLYITDYLNGTVWVFDQTGTLQTVTGTWTGLSEPKGILFDPYNNLIYVADSSSNKVFVYDEQGNAQSFGGFSTGGSSAWGIGLVP